MSCFRKNRRADPGQQGTSEGRPGATLRFRQVRNVPAAADRLDQEHARVHATTQDDQIVGALARRRRGPSALWVSGSDRPKIRGIPTSLRSRDLAIELSIPLTTIEEVQATDVTIDGADEFDPHLAARGAPDLLPKTHGN